MRPTLIGGIYGDSMQKDQNLNNQRMKFVKTAEKRTGKPGYTLMIAKANFGSETAKKEVIIG